MFDLQVVALLRLSTIFVVCLIDPFCLLLK